MSLLTEQEIGEIAEASSVYTDKDMVLLGVVSTFARAIESAVIAKIKAQGPVAWLHEQRTDSDVVTDAVKFVWGKVAVGNLAAYSIPLYKLPEGD